MRLALAAMVLVAACARPLTENETQIARDVFGDGLNPAQVRIAKDLGIVPPPRSATVEVEERELGPDPCRREPTPPRTESPPGFAIGNTIFLQDGIYQADSGLLWPDAIAIPQTFVFIHELVHVWQWQNRAETGYSPLIALAEGLPGRDAYFYEPGRELGFEDFGYEQQAAILEDYLCHVAFDPSNPRRAELRAILDPVLPMDGLDAALGGAGR